MTQVLADAVDRLHDEDLLQRTNQVYTKLRAASQAWKGVMRERAEIEGTLADGLDNE
jgi:hypothetical protein